MSASLRVAIIADFLEEEWPSMDLIAETIAAQLASRFAGKIQPTLIRPALPRRVSRLKSGSRRLLNADRVIGRFLDYPNRVRALRPTFDLFHIIDHSYAHLVDYLPAERTVVTCHDLDAFRCILTPSVEPRSEVFRAVTRRILRGLQSAAHVTCVSEATRQQLLRCALLPPDRISVIHNGVDPAFSTPCDEKARADVTRLLGPADPERIELLHVGSTIPRKRIDLLLRTLAGVRERWPQCRLVQVGGDLTPAQWRLAHELGLRDAILITPRLDRQVLSAIYQRAMVLMMTSDAEGFGLPLLESLSCRTPVLASRIAVLAEVGGDVVEYAAVGDVDDWVAQMHRLLTEHSADPRRWTARRDAGVLRAAAFSWDNAVNQLVDRYYRVTGGTDANSAHR